MVLRFVVDLLRCWWPLRHSLSVRTPGRSLLHEIVLLWKALSLHAAINRTDSNNWTDVDTNVCECEFVWSQKRAPVFLFSFLSTSQSGKCIRNEDPGRGIPVLHGIEWMQSGRCAGEARFVEGEKVTVFVPAAAGQDCEKRSSAKKTAANPFSPTLCSLLAVVLDCLAARKPQAISPGAVRSSSHLKHIHSPSLSTSHLTPRTASHISSPSCERKQEREEMERCVKYLMKRMRHGKAKITGHWFLMAAQSGVQEQRS